MRLHYCEHLPNFGDRLNPWLLPKLLPGCFDRDPQTACYGIGTLLGNAPPPVPRKVVFGSGAGHGPPPAIDDSWDIRCVRGPLTARALGIDADFAATDPAALVAAYIRKPWRGTTRPLFMPHHLSARRTDWSIVAANAGLDYIDPAGPVDTILARIAAAPLVLTESLHGAVVADALRVPWVALRMYPHILEFKWRDWCASLDVEYAPVQLPPLWNVWHREGPLVAAKILLRRAWHAGDPATEGAPRRPLRSASAEIEATTEALSGIARWCRPQLSADGVLASRTARLRDEAERLRADTVAAFDQPGSRRFNRSLRFANG